MVFWDDVEYFFFYLFGGREMVSGRCKEKNNPTVLV